MPSRTSGEVTERSSVVTRSRSVPAGQDCVRSGIKREKTPSVSAPAVSGTSDWMTVGFWLGVSDVERQQMKRFWTGRSMERTYTPAEVLRQVR